MSADQPPLEAGLAGINPTYGSASANVRYASQFATPPQGMNAHMVEQVTIPLLDAKLEAVEARSVGREATLAGKMDVILERVGAVAKDVASLSQDVADYRKDVSGVKDVVKGENVFTRWTIFGTIVASAIGVLALVLTTQGSMQAANGNVLGAIQAGLAMKAATQPQPAALEKK
jgi:hypothetical protein